MSAATGGSAVVSVGGHRIHTMTTGSGPGVPLLLIMGLGGNCDMWSSLLQHLPGRMVIAFDAPGTGRSTTPTWPVSVPALADIAAQVLAHYEVEQADVLGYSYGGAIAQQLAAQHAGLVRRLVLAATTMGAGSTLGKPEATRELSSPMRYYDAQLFEKTAATVYGGKVARDAELRADLAAARSGHPPSPYGYALQLVGGMAWTSRSFAASIEQPTLIISGGDDPLVPLENVRAMGAAIPNSVVRVFPDAGHLLLMDDVTQVAPVVVDFLDGLPSSTVVDPDAKGPQEG